MKVVLCWPNFEPTNAAGVRGRSFATHLAGLGCDVRAITVPDARATEDAPCPVETMPLFLHPRHAPALLGGTGRLAARLRAIAPDIVVASSPPSTFAWQAARAASRAGIPYVADVRDLFTAGMRAVFGPRARYVVAEGLESRFYRDAAAVCTATALMGEKLVRDFPEVDASRLHVVPNGADPVPRPAVPPARDLDVLFVGEMFDRGRRGADLLDAYARVLKHRPQTRFTFVGWERNAYTDSLLAAASREVRAALDLHGRVPRAEVAAFAWRARCGVVPVHPADVFRTMLPAKAYEYVQCEVPIVGLGPEGDSELRRFVEGNDVGSFTTSPAEMAEAILRIVTSERDRMRLGDVARRVAPSFTRARAAERLHKDVLVPLVGGRRP